MLAAGYENSPVPECHVEERMLSVAIMRLNDLGELVAYWYRIEKQNYEHARDLRMERLLQEEKVKIQLKKSRDDLNSTTFMTEDESQWFPTG